MTTTTIGANINSFINDNHLTKKAFITRLIACGGENITERTLHKWMWEGSYPNMKNLLALSKLLNCTIDELLKEQIKEVQETSSNNYDTLSSQSRKLLVDLLRNNGNILFKVSVTEKDWVADFSTYYTFEQARQEYENRLKNEFLQERLIAFLIENKGKPFKKDELFNYCNVEVQPAEDDEATKLYPNDKKNVVYYAEISSLNSNWGELNELDISEYQDISLNTETTADNEISDLNFAFLNSKLPDIAQMQEIKKLSSQVKSTIQNLFGELLKKGIISPEIRSSIHEFVDYDGGQRMENCVMDFILVKCKLLLSDVEIESFLKNELPKIFNTLK